MPGLTVPSKVAVVPVAETGDLIVTTGGPAGSRPRRGAHAELAGDQKSCGHLVQGEAVLPRRSCGGTVFASTATGAVACLVVQRAGLLKTVGAAVGSRRSRARLYPLRRRQSRVDGEAASRFPPLR